MRSQSHTLTTSGQHHTPMPRQFPIMMENSHEKIFLITGVYSKFSRRLSKEPFTWLIQKFPCILMFKTGQPVCQLNLSEGQIRLDLTSGRPLVWNPTLQILCVVKQPVISSQNTIDQCPTNSQSKQWLPMSEFSSLPACNDANFVVSLMALLIVIMMTCHEWQQHRHYNNS